MKKHISNEDEQLKLKHGCVDLKLNDRRSCVKGWPKMAVKFPNTQVTAPANC